MSSKKSLDANGIIERAKQALGIKTNLELANMLGIMPNTISSWKSRGNIDLNAIVALCENTNADWLIYGKGSPEDAADPLTKKILTMLEDMDEEQKRDVLRYVKKEKLLEELLKKYEYNEKVV